MNRFILLIIICLSGCQESARKPTVPDHSFHRADLRISRGQNLLADSTALSAYLKDHQLSFVSVQDMAINPADNGLFVLTLDNTITKLDQNGAPLYFIAAQGKGPGEFTGSYALKVRNNHLYVYDKQLNKISKYGLDGDFIRDIVPENTRVNAFEVAPEGDIIIPNLYSAHEGALFLLYNEAGQQIGQFGHNDRVQDALKATKMLPLVDLSLSDSGKLILFFTTPGTFYAFDWESKQFDYKFSIQGGPEWEASFEAEKNRRGFSKRIRDICFTSDGHMLVDSDRRFKDKVSIGLQYGPDRAFLGRIFASKQLQYAPSQMVMVNDSTLWAYNTPTYQLFRTHLRPAGYQEKE